MMTIYRIINPRHDNWIDIFPFFFGLEQRRYNFTLQIRRHNNRTHFPETGAPHKLLPEPDVSRSALAKMLQSKLPNLLRVLSAFKHVSE
jgi:hypothetical protein